MSILTGLQFIYLFVNLFNIYFSFSLSLYLIIFSLQPPSSSSSPTVAQIIAITLGAVLFLVLIGAVLYFLYKQDHICKSRQVLILPNSATVERAFLYLRALKLCDATSNLLTAETLQSESAFSDRFKNLCTEISKTTKLHVHAFTVRLSVKLSNFTVYHERKQKKCGMCGFFST